MINYTYKKKMKTSKKVVYSALAFVSILLLAVVVGTVAVLAAQTQTISSSITISYTAKEVNARLKLTQYSAFGDSNVLTSSADVVYSDFVMIHADENGISGSIGNSNLTLDKTNNFVVYEYEFVNMGHRMLRASMDISNLALDNANIGVTYYYTNTKLTYSQFGLIDQSAQHPQAVMGDADGEMPVYFYVKLRILNRGLSGKYNADFGWTFDGSNPSATYTTLSLNNGGGSATPSSIQALGGAKLPILTTLPTGQDNKAFMGYYDAATGGNRYIDARGLPVYDCVWGTATLNSGSVVSTTNGPLTLYAQYSDVLVVNNGEVKVNSALLPEQRASITEIEIPSGVTTIARSGFANCTGLTSIVVPSSVTTIKDRAFENCSNLKTFIWEGGGYFVEENQNISSLDPLNKQSNSATLLGDAGDDDEAGLLDYVFKGCTSLETAVIRKDCASIGIRIFSGCSHLQSVTLPWLFDYGTHMTDTGGIADEMFYSPFQALFLPETFDEGDYDNYMATYVVQPYHGRTLRKVFDVRYVDNLTLSIQPWSAYVPSTLTSVTINYVATESLNTDVPEQDAAKALSDSAFVGMTNLRTLIFTDDCGLTDIRECACYGCTNLTTVVLPDTLKSIEWRGFKNCERLTSISLPTTMTNLSQSAFHGCASLVNVSIPTALTPSSYTNRDGQTVELPGLGPYAFKDTKIASISIPSGITEIGNYTFRNCIFLTSVTIPNNITKINQGAFEGCTRLSSLSFQAGGSSLELVKYSFLECPALKTVELPASLTNMWEEVFSPNDVEVFTSLSSTYLASNNCVYQGVEGGFNLILAGKGRTGAATRLPAPLISIEMGAIPESLATSTYQNGRYIDYDYNCDGNITSDEDCMIFVCPIDKTATAITFHMNTKYVCSLRGMENLKELRLPAGLCNISEGAIRNCTSLEYLEFTEMFSVEPKYSKSYLHIFTANDIEGSEGQAKYSALKYITIHPQTGSTTLKDWAFMNCPMLEFVDLDFSYTRLGKQSFYATGIRAVILPNVTWLATEVFRSCVNLTTYYFGANQIEIDRDWWQGNPDMGVFGEDTPIAQHVYINASSMNNFFTISQADVDDGLTLSKAGLNKLNGASNASSTIHYNCEGVGWDINFIYVIRSNFDKDIVALKNYGTYVPSFAPANDIYYVLSYVFYNRTIGTLDVTDCNIDWRDSQCYYPDHVETLITTPSGQSFFADNLGGTTSNWTAIPGMVDNYIILGESDSSGWDAFIIAEGAENLYLINTNSYVDPDLKDALGDSRYSDLVVLACKFETFEDNYSNLGSLEKLYVIPTATSYADYYNSASAALKAYLDNIDVYIYSSTQPVGDGNYFYYVDASGNATTSSYYICGIAEW